MLCLCLLSVPALAQERAQLPAALPLHAAPQTQATPTPVPGEDGEAAVDLNALLDIKVEVTSRQPESIFDTASDVIVIDRKTIELYGFRTVAEALDSVSGVQVSRSYFKRDIPTLRGVLQESYADKVLTLINGVPNWMANTGEGSIDRLDIHDIERIEVLKGPASVIYGSNAYAGAINFVLRTQLDDRGEVYSRVGSATMIQGGGHFTHSLGNFKISGFANGGTDQGTTTHFIDETGVHGIVHDQVRQNNVSLVGEYNGSQHHHTLLFNGFSNQESFLGVTSSFASGAGLSQQVGGYLASYKYRYTSEKADVEAGFTYDYQSRNFPRMPSDVQRTDVRGQRFTPFLRVYYRPLKSLALEAGADTDVRNAIHQDLYDSHSGQVLQMNHLDGRWMNETSVYAQGRFSAATLWRRIPILATLGLRYTYNDYTGGFTSARFTLNYRITETQSLKLIGAKSFRAPTLYELYFVPTVNTIYGNPALKPETSNSLELTYTAGLGKFFGTATAYAAGYDDIIYRATRPSDPTGASQQFWNGKQITALGYELDVKYQDPRIINAYLGFSYVDGHDNSLKGVGSQYNFEYVPKAMLSAGVSRSLGNFSIAATMKFLGKQHTNFGDLPPQAILNANVGYRWGRTLHKIVLENAFNHQLQFPDFARGTLQSVPSGYGRRLYYSFQYEFF